VGQRRERLIRRDIAQDPAGKRYSVFVYVVEEDVSGIGDSDAAWTEVSRMIFTTGKQPLNYLAKGQYQFPTTGLAIRSTSPDAE
jgi:hypothetical protein